MSSSLDTSQDPGLNPVPGGIYDYSVDSLSRDAYTGYAKLATGGDITQLLQQMLGFLPDTTSANHLPGDPDDLKDVSLQRIQRIYLFWNELDNETLNQLGGIFSIQSDIGKPDPTGTADIRNKNSLITYLLVLFFKGILSSPDSINLAKPLDMFTSPADKEDFSLAIVNLIKFTGLIKGLGNYPVFRDPNSDASNIDTYWNNGFIFNHCREQYLKFCNNSSGFKDSTTVELKDPEKDQDCVQQYRKKLSETPLALSWCGCFTSIPTFVKNAIINASKKNGTALGSNIPSVCDNLCYKESVTVSDKKNSYTAGVIPYYRSPYNTELINGSNEAGTPITCIGATICVIDKNNISSVNTTGDINFNQICKCTAGAPCMCYIDTTTPGILDNIRSGENGMLNQANFNQVCNNAICYKIEKGGDYLEVKCNGINTPSTGGVFGKNKNGLAEKENYEKIYDNFWYSLIFLTFVFVVFIFSYFEISRKIN